MPFGAPITSRSNARVKALRASFSGHAAKPGELLGLEGEHLIAEALRSGLALASVFMREGSEAMFERAGLAALRGAEVTMLSRDVFASAVETASPQGIAAMVAIPEQPAQSDHTGSGPWLLLESLQDPGNVGTLLRSAEAFGTPCVWMTQDCVNLWNPKVVRASAGSVFRMPFERKPLKAMHDRLCKGGFTLYAAVARGEHSRSLVEVEFAALSAVLIGNEGAGLSDAALAMADVPLTIPCAVESLNAAVAGSTILYEAMRQRLLRAGSQR